MRRQVHGRRQPRPAPGGAPQGEWGPGMGKGSPGGLLGRPGGLLELLKQSRGCLSHRLPAPVGAGGRAQPVRASPTAPPYFGCCSALFWAHAGGIPPGGGLRGLLLPFWLSLPCGAAARVGFVLRKASWQQAAGEGSSSLSCKEDPG